jgi:starch synthase
MSKLKILYVAKEIAPFVEVGKVAEYVRSLPEAMQERGMEIRILVPRFGNINERRNRLHEVVRLSGINITVGLEDKPLVIKVASIPATRLQVYFLDNDDYFHRKSDLFDANGNFYSDNDERAIFFCKGVMETVKKLGWAPDIIHCHDWMTSLIPLYLKTHYKKEPIYQNSKVIFSVYNTSFEHKFTGNIVAKAKMNDIDEKYLAHLSSADYAGFIRMGIEYADAIFKSEDSYSAVHHSIFEEYNYKKGIQYSPKDRDLEFYYNFYNELSGVNECVAE